MHALNAPILPPGAHCANSSGTGTAVTSIPDEPERGPSVVFAVPFASMVSSELYTPATSIAGVGRYVKPMPYDGTKLSLPLTSRRPSPPTSSTTLPGADQIWIDDETSEKPQPKRAPTSRFGRMP